MTKKTARYIQVYEEIRERIVSGSFSYGSRIPSKREMAQEKGISVITVEHAYELLAEEGYIESRPRSGCYVIYRDSDLIHVEKAEADTMPDFTFEADVFPLSVYSTAVRKVLSEKQAQLPGRTEGRGCAEIRTAIASYLNRSRGMQVSADQVVIGAGSEYLYSLIVQLLGRDQIYGIEDPCYENISRMYAHNDVKVEKLKLGANGIRSEELGKTDAAILHVTPYHSYPSGRSADASKRIEYIRWAKARNAMIVEDDYASEFSPFLKAQETLFSMEPLEHVIYLNTFTRTIGPSVRVGYMILPEKTKDRFLERIAESSCTVSTLSQLVIAELLNSGSFERHINRVRRRLRRAAESPENS